MKHPLLTFCILLLSISCLAGNKISTNTQVTTAVTLSTNEDYRISSTTPFTTTGSINITNTDRAVVIFDNIKPSEATSWLGYVYINGAAVVNGTNCMVKIYKHGSIIMPYASGFQPLTVYSGENYTGTSYTDFNVKTGYNLTTASLNNHIRSFKLKRGYMAFMSTKQNGYGYNRVFIAATEDCLIPVAQLELYDKVSYIKILQWNDVSKKGLAGNDDTRNALLNTNWCYNWDAGTNSWADREYVTHHHHEGWPAIATVGTNGTSPNSLGNNEPDNTTGAEQYNTVNQVLANWPAMMATGKRLGSPAVAGNYQWLYDFIDSIDARGWRCDFIAVHAYWYSDAAAWKSQLDAIHTRTKRPIWITEMNYGANWTGWPGTTTDGTAANYAIEKQHFAPIIDQLDDLSYVERYAVYNNVQACRMVYNADDATLASTSYLTPMGEYYAADQPWLASKGASGSTSTPVPSEVVPTAPRYVPPYDLRTSYHNGICSQTWKDDNGEFSKSFSVERKKDDGTYASIGTVTAVDNEQTATYTYADNIGTSGNYTYRIHAISYDDKDYYSNEDANFGGTTMDTSAVMATDSDYTLEVTGAADKVITVKSGLYTYTPTTSGLVRFVKKDGVIYVYEGNKYKGTVTESAAGAGTYPAIFSAADDSVLKTGIYDTRNLFRNPGFEQLGAAIPGKSGNRAVNWDCNGYTFSNPSRVLASTLAEGSHSFYIHGYGQGGVAECLSQKVKLKSNTSYKIQFASWPSSDNNVYFTVAVGTSAGNSSVMSKSINVGASKTTIKNQSMTFTTGTLSADSVVFSLTRVIRSGETYQARVDRMSMVEMGAYGVTGTASATVRFMPNVALPPVLEVTMDENIDYTPSAATAVGVTLKRTLKGGMWNTICLPFGLSASQLTETFGSGVKVASMTSYDGSLLQFANANSMTANTPYLIWMPKGGNLFTINSADIESATNSLTATAGNMDMTGTYTSGTVLSGRYFISDNKLYLSSGKSPIKGFRAYLTPQNGAKVNSFSVDGIVTSVSSVAADKMPSQGRIYDASGRKISGNSLTKSSLPRGIYIHDGKKVVIK